MAIYNEILSGRFAKLSQKLFSMKGDQAVKQLSGELMMVQVLPFGVEHRALLLESRFGTTINITGAASDFAAFRFVNPVGSGIIGVIESLILANAGAAALVYNQNQTSTLPGSLGTIVGNIRLDNRVGVTGSALVNSTSTTLTGSPISPNTGQYSVPAGATFQCITTENQEITIAPGDTWTIGANAAATQLLVSLIWRERPLEESETRQ